MVFVDARCSDAGPIRRHSQIDSVCLEGRRIGKADDAGIRKSARVMADGEGSGY
jgi:hypothetical protein